MAMNISYPDSSDLEEIIELYEVTWLDTYPNEEHGITVQDIEDKNNTKSRSEKVALMSSYLESNKDNPKYFFQVAKLEDRVVGVCGGREEDDFVHMATMYVLPTEQKKGVGGLLIQSFLDWAKVKNKPIRLHVVTYNKSAIRFYEKWGFRDNGKRFTEERFKMTSGNYLPEMEMIYNQN